MNQAETCSYKADKETAVYRDQEVAVFKEEDDEDKSAYEQLGSNDYHEDTEDGSRGENNGRLLYISSF